MLVCCMGPLVAGVGDVSAHDDSVTRGHLCQVWGSQPERMVRYLGA